MTDTRWSSRHFGLGGFATAFLTALVMQIVVFGEPLTVFVGIRAFVQGAVLGAVFYFGFPVESTEN